MQDSRCGGSSLQLVFFSKALTIYLKANCIKDDAECSYPVKGPKFTWTNSMPNQMNPSKLLL